ncbi:NADPH-dependent FMN reductase [Massilia sp. 9I]|uniref:NADPH-dependent FMN reductase n=1 Tax=Massilia sp. 9I TaxID=2653152 RepID=UPI0012F40451|nr:NADPH-dependent FMN reductase [Massilia sp. 9I]VXB58672.1 FMN reductase (NADPH) [Massilia sp. 9I]
MSVLLLGGSPSPQSSCTRLLQYIGDRLALQGHRPSRIEVRELPAEALLLADTANPELARAVQLVQEASVIVVATPVYKAAYTGLLKAFLDLLPQDGLAGKAVLPIATGGSQSHMLALDYALRPVLASMSARFILPSIYATSDQVSWHTEYGLALAPPIAARIAQGIEQLGAELGRPLRAAA